MSSRYLTLMSVERLLVAERYRQTHQPTPSAHATRIQRPDGPGTRAKAARPHSGGTSAKGR
jgi:hypothetical protein